MSQYVKPWWDFGKLELLMDGQLGYSWSCQSLEIQAFKGQSPTVLRRSTTGLYRGSLDEFVAEIVKAFPKRITFIDNHHSLGSEFTDGWAAVFGIWERGAIKVAYEDDEITLDFATNDRDDVEPLQAVAQKLLKSKASPGRVYVLHMAEHGPVLTFLGQANQPLIESNYEPDVIKDFRHAVEDLQSSDPCGRMIFLHGRPGTGKTYLTRAVLDQITTSVFILVPPEIVPQLGGPSFIKTLIDVKTKYGAKGPTILLVEDADSVIVPRGSDNMSAISSLLNLTDGILGASIDMRVIATTNSRGDEIDEALKRPGRLCRRIHVGDLSGLMAMTVFKRLTGRDGDMLSADKAYSLAEVYRLAKDAGWKPEPAVQSLGFKSAKEPEWSSNHSRFTNIEDLLDQEDD
jgi:hypothetical protein